MSYQGRYGTQAPAISDVDDSWQPNPYPPARRCTGCNKKLASLNTSTLCFTCQRIPEVKERSKRIGSGPHAERILAD